ncbi:MAG: hypothetical protein JXM69_19640 [Anaerolineae bacterium]|nr:hypothetical protein [Anaerolineae bacterium]
MMEAISLADFVLFVNTTTSCRSHGYYQRTLNDIEQIEKALDSLETQRNILSRQLDEQVLTEQQVLDIKAFAAKITEDLEIFEDDFEGRRRLIEMLDVRVTLNVEDGQKVAYAQCRLGEKRLSVIPNTTIGFGTAIRPGDGGVVGHIQCFLDRLGETG